MKKSLLGKLIVLIGIVSIWIVLVGVPNVTQAEGDSVETLAVDPEYNMADIFPDEEFRKAVVINFHEISIPVSAEGKIKQSELDSLTSLSASQNPNFKDLTGIKYFKNLEKVNFSLTGVDDLNQLLGLPKLYNIRVTAGPLTDATPLLELAKNNVKSFYFTLSYNKISDFSFLSKLENDLISRKKYYSFGFLNQEIDVKTDQRITEVPTRLAFPKITLHDGSSLSFEETDKGRFDNGDFILDELATDSRAFKTTVKKTTSGKATYSFNFNVSVPNNYLLPNEIETNFTQNVNEKFDFERPFSAVVTNSPLFLLRNSYVVTNKNNFNINKPGKYELDYELYKFKNTDNPLEAIPFKVTVNLLPVNYNVAFYSDNGEKYIDTKTNKEMKVSRPEKDPVKDGYIFEGWTYTEGGKDFVDFNQLITGNKTYFAKWKKYKYAVTYYLDGEASTVYQTTHTKQDLKIVEPNKEPEKEGHFFVGWTYYPYYLEYVDFTQPINKDISLYAQWQRYQYNVTFYYDHGIQVFQSGETDKSMTINQPTKEPKKDGYIFKGWTYSYDGNDYADFNQTILGDTAFYAKWEKDKPQGNYIPDGRYVTVFKKGYDTTSDFDGNPKYQSEAVYQKTFLAKGRYEHRNGKTYYSLYNNKGKWLGYLDSNATKVASGKQGIFFKENKYVTINKKDYGTYHDFNWNSRLTSKQVINKTYYVKGRYVHANGSIYYSLYDNKGKWQGYINAAATKNGKGKQGAYMAFNKNVKVTKKNYSTYQNFNWKKKFSSNKLINGRYQVRGMYHHINGTTYYSLYNLNGTWQGYISEKAVK